MLTLAALLVLGAGEKLSYDAKALTYDLKVLTWNGNDVFATAGELCSALGVGDKAGAWWCLKGDGTMGAGSMLTLSPVNSPETLSWPVCPSGTSCTLEAQSRLSPITGTDTGYASGSTASPAGSFTACALSAQDTRNVSGGPDGTQSVLSFHNPSDTKVSINASLATSATGTTVSCTSGCNSVSDAIPALNRQMFLRCAVFTSGVSTQVCTFQQGDLLPTCVSVASAGTRIGTPAVWRTNNDSIPFTGMFRGAFMSEVALTAADIGRIGVHVLPPKPTGMTFVRASVKTCCAGVKCVAVPANMPCMVRNLAQVDGAATNEFGGAIGPGVTLFDQQGYSIFGMKNVTRYAIPATPASCGASPCGAEMHQWSRTVGVGTKTCSVYAMTSDGSNQTLDICSRNRTGNNAALWLDYDCSTCAVNGTEMTRCSISTQAATVNVTCAIGNLSGYLAVNGGPARDAKTLLIMGSQVEEGTTATSYVLTDYRYLSPQTRAAESCSGTGCP